MIKKDKRKTMRIGIALLLICVCLIIQQLHIQRLQDEIKKFKANENQIKKILIDLLKKLNK